MSPKDASSHRGTAWVLGMYSLLRIKLSGSAERRGMKRRFWLRDAPLGVIREVARISVLAPRSLISWFGMLNNVRQKLANHTEQIRVLFILTGIRRGRLSCPSLRRGTLLVPAQPPPILPQERLSLLEVSYQKDSKPI